MFIITSIITAVLAGITGVILFFFLLGIGLLLELVFTGKITA